MSATIEAITCSLNLVMYRKAVREKRNEAMPAAPDNRALLTFSAVPS